MRARLLLDAHVPADVAHAVSRLCPQADIQHVSSWQDGAYINATDDVFLEACWQEGRALVSKDRATLPGSVALRVADNQQHAGVLFYDLERFKANQIGALAKAIAAVLATTKGNLVNRWIAIRYAIQNRLGRLALSHLRQTEPRYPLRDGIFKRVRFPSPAPLIINGLRSGPVKVQ